MSSPNQVITIPTTSPSSATPSPSSATTSSGSDQETDGRLLDSNPKKKRYMKERLKSCREKTLESELCRTINKYMSKCLNDDKCRRMIAITIMVLALVGVYHILMALF